MKSKRLNLSDYSNVLSSSRITSFSQFYKEICIKRTTKINNTILNGLKNTDLVLNLDTLSQTDSQPLSIVLENCRFNNIKLTGGLVINSESNTST